LLLNLPSWAMLQAQFYRRFLIFMSSESSKRAKIKTTKAATDSAMDVSAHELSIEQFLTYRLNVLSNMLNRQMERFLKHQFNIALPDWRVVAILGRFRDVRSIRDVAARSRMDKALVSRAVARLIQRGLINSRPDPKDGRLVVLSLTAAGHTLYEAIMPQARKRQLDLLSGLDPQERAALEKALDKLIGLVSEKERYKSETDTAW